MGSGEGAGIEGFYIRATGCRQQKYENKKGL
jgi:hypothetical protein